MSQNRLSVPKLEYALQQVGLRCWLLSWLHYCTRPKTLLTDTLQLCELRVEVKPGKAVFITVRLQLVLCW